MKEYQKNALLLAKHSILKQLWSPFPDIPRTWKLTSQWASFVTLMIDNKHLRWCIGSITSRRQLDSDIIANAKNAAFWDPRFPNLTKEEIDSVHLHIEITILSPLKEEKFKDYEWLFSYLWEKTPWLVIELNSYWATFLPAVWKHIPNPEEFLTHLIYKAWMEPEYFKKNFSNAKISTYTWEEFWAFWEEIV